MAKAKTRKKTKTVRERGDPRKLSYMTASGPPRDERGRFISKEQAEAESKKPILSWLFRKRNR